MGNKIYALLRNIVYPKRPRDLSFVEIVDNFTKHLDPKPTVTAERFKFHKAEQQESESIRDFLARLKKLAETCEFRGYREETIRVRFVCGLNERTIERKLLAVTDLTLQSAVEKTCAAELTENKKKMHCMEEVWNRRIKKNYVPRVLSSWESQPLVGYVFLLQFQVPWLQKGWSHC